MFKTKKERKIYLIPGKGSRFQKKKGTRDISGWCRCGYPKQMHRVKKRGRGMIKIAKIIGRESGFENTSA